MKTQLMPSLFIGHGSPLNALMDNSFTQQLHELGKTLKPKKILIISAHWMTSGVKAHASATPKMIYDFYGFPEPLYKINYPAPGDVDLAKSLAVDLDHDWGFDHGTWTVLYHLFPEANIPVVQLSLNKNFTSLKEHYEFAKQLKHLRSEGVLIIGSGNIVHNLRAYDRNPNAITPDWSREFDEMIMNSLLEKKFSNLYEIKNSELLKMSHPSIEHYLPLLYVLGASNENENITFPYEGFEGGSLSMRSVQFN
jgi:4,5-DOPA dioxygenase extradiol